MVGGVTAAFPQSYSVRSLPRIPTKIRRRCWTKTAALPRASRDHPLFSSNLKLISFGPQKFRRTNIGSVLCRSTGDSGENESKIILDAFFLGKALAETLNERIESSVGEFLSTVGRLQAEQQKQIQEFQQDVLEKARRAKEQAASEAMEAQGLTSKSYAADVSAVNGGVTATTTSAADSVTFSDSSFGSNSTLPPAKDIPKSSNEDPLLGLLNED